MKINLGLCEPPTPFYIFVGEAPEGCLWYFLAPNSTDKVPVREHALCGSLREVRVIQKEGRKKGEMLDKLELVVDADRLYVLRSGLDTNWSRCILLALEQTADLASPLYFCVRPSDRNEKIVFGSVYTSSGERVMHEWDGERDLTPVVASLRARLGLADATEPRTVATPAAPPPQPRQAQAGVARELSRAEAHTGIHTLRKKLVTEGFETWKSLNEMLGRDYGCVEVEELTREDAIKCGTALKELYRRHIKGNAEQAVAR